LLSRSCLDYLSSDSIREEYLKSNPFPHVILDEFFDLDLASQIASEFPDYDDKSLDLYSNSIEEKRLINNWNKFGEVTYSAFSYLCSNHFVDLVKFLVPDSSELIPDVGLHGGGLHMHSAGGKLNVHLDYSMHPKLKLQRKLNLLVYLTPDWDNRWGGSLGLYNNESDRAPGELVKIVEPIFNRAILFDVTQNSWHGLPSEIKCPEGITRNSIAIYYLQEPDELAQPTRQKAKFAPSPWQIGDVDVLNLIEKRSGILTSRDVYEDNK
tara:strand:+ start:706 stop:1506 length:801 start_codon:yes stop_codon:yes gene_type:complete